MAKSKYEIMLLLSPNEDISVVKKIADSVFGKGVESIEKLEDNKLRYEINNSKTATRVLIKVEAERKDISEFTRKSNIQKTIWRTLVINLDTEKGLNKKPKQVVDKRKNRNFENKFTKQNNPNFKVKKENFVKKTEETKLETKK
ncbi:30S ribosomal protein S6 [Mesomycoplasma neurolyticum]|uniref:Small ribosomal subunit protein bS6 n=1 Tax=Mesomycoplasma neurolyticum TaxID=2120 RepID=A0A449A5Z4_9BACT|nr:30S ribosomal protein S6 [Mesomycoplasma neurolyticum]VEU59647.1 30S ribosomal protein S6 [Mesomycoplasma neurolyticum]